MAYNGSGIFNRIYNWVNDANAAIDISASRMDTEDSGFATGLSNAICKDGQTTITANLPMAGFKHTGVGNASLVNHYAAYGQVQNSSPLWLGSSASTNTVTAGATPPLTAYAAGQTFRFLAGGTNTTAVTLNIDSLGAKAVQKLGAALIAGDITANNICEVVYDGTQFQLCSPVPVNNAQVIGSVLTGYSSGAGTVASTDTILAAIQKLNGNAAAVSGSELVFIAAANASTSSTLDFTSGIDSTYDTYFITFEKLTFGTASSRLLLQGSVDTGSNWLTGAISCVVDGWSTQGASGESTTQLEANDTGYLMTSTVGTSGTTTISASGFMYLFAPSNAATAKNYRGESVYYDGTHSHTDYFGGSIITASAINGIRFKPSGSSATIVAGSIRLYGVKKS